MKYFLRFFCAPAFLFLALTAGAAAQSSLPRFEITLPASYPLPLNGRVFVIIARGDSPEPRLQVGSWNSHTEFMGRDVSDLQPGRSVAVDALTLGYPLKSIRELPAGDYYVQAVFNIYTRFSRSDGHTILGHLDQWEGQKFNRSPGNLYSDPQRVHLDAIGGYNVRLSLNRTIPVIRMPDDTAWVKHIKIQSKMLTRFWGQPIFLGATVLLPDGYASHPEAHYPVIYEQGHFNLNPPLTFNTEPPSESPQQKSNQRRSGFTSGYDFYKEWSSPKFPRMIAVTFQHPTVFFDDSYAVNSENNGPYGDAIMTELIPYIEEHFRTIRQPYARLLTGGSTGGWESLALQVFHSDFFGGTWTFYPDPVDFSRYQMVDIYSDNNAFVAPGYEPSSPERAAERTDEGQVTTTVKQMSHWEEVMGSHGRSTGQYEAWEAVYGPAGNDGYPRPLWDKTTGRIDPQVAQYMKEHGYDLRAWLEENWARIGPKLANKIFVYCGDMDNFYLNLATYRLEDFLNRTQNPPYGGSVLFGRPMKGHGWHPMNQAHLVRMMAAHVTANAPADGDKSWVY